MNQSWPAPAKLNLFLHITGRRADGYHLLQTAFQFLDYVDDLEFSPRDDQKITLDANYKGVPTDRDLIVRTAQRLQQQSTSPLGVDIRINKRLPMGGGLGGGSSNAATTLVALNCLWNMGLSEMKLAEMGLGLGADVPVFIHGHAAWAEGVGEKLQPLEPPEDWYLVISPGENVSTAEIFNAPDLTRNTPAITIRDFLAGAGRNDCEKIVRSIYPEVARSLDWLAEATQARMTGTGACVYGTFSTKSEAKELKDLLPEAWQGFVAQGRNTSPLLDRLAQEPRQHIR